MDSNELLRLDDVRTKVEPGRILISFAVRCDSDAPKIVTRIKTIIRRIVDCELSFDDSIDDWRSLLPKWFIDQCAAEISKSEAQELMKTPEGYAELSARWTLSGFLYWFRPEMRSWYWFSAGIENSNLAVIVVITDGLPIADGALKFLSTAAGASRIEQRSIEITS